MPPANLPSLSDLKAKASHAVAIEALWDGDTGGWFVELFEVVRIRGEFLSRHLHTFRYGGDMRIFNGEVPPWPEAAAAARVGAELAAALRVRFHFPSPRRPEGNCPHWWERDSGRPCTRCGEVLLLQPVGHPWRGVCHYCHFALERERRDAQFSEAERRGPRCSMCGDPATGDSGSPPRCAHCRATYRDSICPGCDARMTRQIAGITSDYCTGCVMAQRIAALSPDDRRRLRKAVGRGFEALLEAQALLHCDLSEAQEAVAIAAKLGEDGS